MSEFQIYFAALEKLEQSMRKHGLWQEEPMDERALQSRLPFCVDTLKFEQWLQFLFIPRMHYILRHGHALPNAVGLLPMAEQSWDDKKVMFSEVILIIEEIDQLFSLYESNQ